MVHKIKNKLKENIYYGSLNQLLKDKNAINTILRWEDEMQVEISPKRGFGETVTVRYIKQLLGYD